MLELPEIARLAVQADQALKGKRIVCATRGSNPHKWLFFNKDEDEVAGMVEDKAISSVSSKAKWLHIHCEPGVVLSFNEMGGQIRYAESADKLTMKWHFMLRFEDNSCLYAMVQGWGFVQVMSEEELSTQTGPQHALPVLGHGYDASFFRKAVADYPEREKRSVKALITGGSVGVGLGNGYLHDVLFLAGIQPTRKVLTLTAEEIEKLYAATVRVTSDAIAEGGRDVERDLYGNPGGYRPILDKRMADLPCPQCSTPIKKISFIGGSCYFCPTCQS